MAVLAACLVGNFKRLTNFMNQPWCGLSLQIPI
jgi:hypothetical protein